MPFFSAPGKPIAALLLPLAAVLVALGADSEEEPLAPPAPAIALVPERVPDLASVRCANCHAAVAEEWAASAHGIAWIDEHYQKALAERTRPELCAGCHTPEPLVAAAELPRQPKARAEDAADAEPRAHGITCASCHQGDGETVLGPRGSETPAHPTARSAWLAAERSAELCATCHRTNIGPVVGIAKDFPESRAAAAGETCVTCHMAPLERAFANLPDGAPDPAVPVRAGRSHALQTPRDPAFLRRAFALDFRVENGATSVRVANRAGHRVPGLQGRTLTFRFEALQGGRAVAQGELVLDATAYLPVDGEKSVVLAAAADGVRVRAEHLDPRAGAPVVFLEGDVARRE